MTYWQANRIKQKSTLRQWYIGLPLGLVFVVPIALNFSLSWYKRANMVAQASFNPLVLVVALMGIVTFVAIFSKKHQWEMREQKYLELKAREEYEQKNVDLK
jgi:integral membrane sensor domain MASE1